MLTSLQSARNRLVQEIADSYQRRGFYVQIEPTKEDLPEFLKEFHPDLIVRTPEGKHIFVEIRMKGRVRHVDYWQHLQDAIASHPDWRLEFVVNNRREEELINASQPLLTPEEIEARLRASQRLVRQGLPDGALLIVWSALEAILLKMGQAEKIDLPNTASATLITKLTAEGILDREDYDTLMKILPARNQAAHGHQAENVDNAVKQAQSVVRRLLKQQQNLEKAA